jgi:phosphoesterase RecJ-like protein
MLVEQPGGQIKASLRSRSRVDVAAICREFGGGGHVQAAGAMLPGPLEAARERIVSALTRAISRADTPAETGKEGS